jgi:hypothetical protein
MVPAGSVSSVGSVADVRSAERSDQPRHVGGFSQDAGAGFYLSHCPSGVGSGTCTDSDQTVDTGNPQHPAHISNGDCLQCASNGLGTFWSCVSGGWQAQGVYSCQ